jgi:phage tail sheath protein FI
MYPIGGAATSIAAFAGWASRGPRDAALFVSSWADYERLFGGLDEGSLLAYSVYHFFENGGRRAYIVRLVGDAPSRAAAGALQPNSEDFENALLPKNGSGGVYLLDDVDLFNLLCVPGETKPAVFSQLARFCHDRRAFLIADCDRADTFASLRSGPDPAITGDPAINAAFYFPWVNIPDPRRPNRSLSLPPCGFVAGVYAKTDAYRGVWKAPAGLTAGLAGVTSAAVPLTDTENEVLNSVAINCIRDLPTAGTVVWGARTLHGRESIPSEWRYIPVRRLALFLEESLYRGIIWSVSQPNDETLWAQIRLHVNEFLDGLFRQGAFQGNVAHEAYFVKCDRETTTQVDVDQGIVNILVGFAPLKPAEFVMRKIAQRGGP